MPKVHVAVAAAAMLAAVATATGINTEQLRGRRDLYNNDEGWSTAGIGWYSGSSGKSGKSGSGSSSGSWYSGSSGKSGKSGSSGSSSGSWSSDSSSSSWSSSGKSGKSGSSSSSSSSWSSSGKSGKSGSSSSWSSSGKSGKSGSSSSSSWSSSGKSGKSGSGGSSWSSSGKSGKSGSGGWYSSSSWSSSGKSGKSGSSSSSSSWSSSGKSGKSEGWYSWEDSKSGKTKSGKSKGGKSKSDKSGKSSDSKSGKSSEDEWVSVTPAPQPDPTKKPTHKPVPPPTKKPTKKPVAPPAPKPVPVPVPSLDTICFKKGEQIPCSGSPSGDGIVSSFSYTVETKPGYSADDVMIPLENAILLDVAAQVGHGFTGSISAKPSDEINGAKDCSHEKKADCAYVNGAMTFYNDGHGGSDNHGGAYVVAGSSGGGSGSDSSHSDSYSAESALNAHQVMSSDSGSGDSGSGFDACGGATLIHDSMQGNDYSSVDGVKSVEFKEKKSCPVIAAIKAEVVEEEEDNTAMLVGVPLAAALLVALALLIVRRFRDEREEFSLASDLDDFMGPPEDPYASTIDVHKCTSMYCNCNKGLQHVSFIPAPMKVDLNQTRAAAGLPLVAPTTADVDVWQYPDLKDADSDTVTAVQNGSTNGQVLAPETNVPVTEAPDVTRSYLPVEQRPLTTVNEIAHDSEIDTELESVADDDASIPPPPPSHPPDDEMSI